MKQIGQAINTLCLQPADDETAKVQGVCQRIGFQTDQLANSIVGEQVSSAYLNLVTCGTLLISTGQCGRQCQQQLPHILRSTEHPTQARGVGCLGEGRFGSGDGED